MIYSQIAITKPNPLNLKYIRVGKGQPVLLLRGTGGVSKDSYPYLLKELAKEFTVYSFIYPGFEGSTELPTWTNENFNVLISEFLDKMGLNKVHLIGLSIGASFAVSFAVNSPERINRLVLISPSTTSIPKNWLIKGMNNSLFEVRKQNKTLKQLNKKEGSKNNLPPSVFKISSIKNIKTFLKMYKYMRSLSLEKLLPLINVRTSIFIGRQDRLTDVDSEIKHAKLIKNSRLKIFENEGHYLFHNRPIDIVAELRNRR